MGKADRPAVPEVIEVEVKQVDLLESDEAVLLAELEERQRASLDNLRKSFLQLITLSVSLIGLQTTLLTLVGIQPATLNTEQRFEQLISIGLFFLALVLAFIGQLGELWELSPLDLLDTYRKKRTRRLKVEFWLYGAANIAFVLGLSVFVFLMLDIFD